MARNSQFVEANTDENGNALDFGVGGYLILPTVIVHRVTAQNWGGFLKFQSFIRFAADLSTALIAQADLKQNYGIDSVYIPITINIEASQVLLSIKQLIDVQSTDFSDGSILEFNQTTQQFNEKVLQGGIASVQYVQDSLAALIDSAPSTLDTLNELAAALSDDPNFATTITNQLASIPKPPYIQETAPTTDLVAGEFWLDTGNSGHLHLWDGESWVQLTSDTPLVDNAAITQAVLNSITIGANTAIQSSAPTSPNFGDLWLDTTDGELYTWNSSSWIQTTQHVDLTGYATETYVQNYIANNAPSTTPTTTGAPYSRIRQFRLVPEFTQILSDVDGDTVTIVKSEGSALLTASDSSGSISLGVPHIVNGNLNLVNGSNTETGSDLTVLVFINENVPTTILNTNGSTGTISTISPKVAYSTTLTLQSGSTIDLSWTGSVSAPSLEGNYEYGFVAKLNGNIIGTNQYSVVVGTGGTQSFALNVSNYTHGITSGSATFTVEASADGDGEGTLNGNTITINETT